MKKQTTISGHHFTIMVIVLFLGMILRGLSQPIELNLKCMDRENSTPITPDSIVVTNNSLNLDTVLVNGETTLTLCNEPYTGIKQIQADNELSMQVYPNPAGGNTTILFSTDTSNRITLSMYNAAGKRIQSWSRYLDKGLHTFEAGFPENGIYMFHAAPHNYSAKVVVTDANNSSKGIRYKKASTDKPKDDRLKSSSGAKNSTSSDTCFPYESGNKLKIEGYKRGYKKVIEYKSPDTSQTDTLSFYKPNSCPSTVTDYDGNVYDVVQIEDQCWIAENLKVTTYSDGTPIPQVTDSAAWSNLTETDKAWCYYDNSSSNGDTYGALYTWAAAMNGAASSNSNPSDVQGVCPDGWHLPSDKEWKELDSALGNDVGSKLADSANLWQDGYLKLNPEFGTSGFIALPGGDRNHQGEFNGIGDRGLWWCSNEESPNKAYNRDVYYHVSNLGRGSDYKESGFSVRCVRDE